MNANSFESLIMTNGGARVLRILLKQVKSVVAKAKWASDDQNSKPEMISFNFEYTLGPAQSAIYRNIVEAK